MVGEYIKEKGGLTHC